MIYNNSQCCEFRQHLCCAFLSRGKDLACLKKKKYVRKTFMKKKNLKSISEATWKTVPHPLTTFSTSFKLTRFPTMYSILISVLSSADGSQVFLTSKILIFLNKLRSTRCFTKCLPSWVTTYNVGLTNKTAPTGNKAHFSVWYSVL